MLNRTCRVLESNAGFAPLSVKPAYAAIIRRMHVVVSRADPANVEDNGTMT